MPKSRSPVRKNNVSSKISLLFLFLIFPLSFVLCAFFPNIIYAASVTLSWDANTEPDLAGYSIYYSTTSGSYTTSDRLDVDKNMTSVTITGLNLYTIYYFVITAYNTEGYESDYSNEVTTLTSKANRAASGGGSGGGGGCFITTTVYESGIIDEVLSLNKLSGNYLLKTLPGRVRVNGYYTISASFLP